MKIIDYKSYLLLGVIVKKAKGSTGVTCLIFVLSSTIMMCSPMRFSNKMHAVSLPT